MLDIVIATTEIESVVDVVSSILLAAEICSLKYPCMATLPDLVAWQASFLPENIKHLIYRNFAGKSLPENIRAGFAGKSLVKRKGGKNPLSNIPNTIMYTKLI